ncbi:MurR/RpiR family transcriptional regulator [Pseudalkalibacillus berkeleyi]|uniref:MurR/RpiR family transcriptional regulator n=1 Tax=Pseudalkalibacillus berkeleyi TaxID=1069813 RepID=A0ABS9H1N1_9BACL|nr:MurR/RpiR family transcriptional regulator [Pseudalkalibacillus berkeleyi]MCF6137735.1 MurR/RpiR family transcriptional regulator [Pseudalkalibacillus berkeleyi]
MLKEMHDKLPPSEKKIASFILQDPRAAISSTTSELAQLSQTSSAAVIRLCKSLGLKGFQELKMKVVGDLQKSVHEGYRDIQPNESHASVLEKMTNNSIQSLKETGEMLHLSELSRSVEALENAGTIHFFGVGASAIIAQDAQQKFLRIHKNVTAFSDLHMVAMLVGNVKPEDVVVGISFSGETAEVAQILELANQKGATTISLTKYGSSKVSEQAKIKLYTSASKEATFRSGATSSRIAQLHVLDILFMCVASTQYDASIQYLDESRNAIEYIQQKRRK